MLYFCDKAQCLNEKKIMFHIYKIIVLDFLSETNEVLRRVYWKYYTINTVIYAHI